MYEKSFITSELIESYVYHDVDYERLVEFNKNVADSTVKISEIFRKSKRYAVRAGYSTLGFAEYPLQPLGMLFIKSNLMKR